MKVERCLGIIAVVVATPVALAAWRFGVGTPRSPGAGFWPLTIACVMLVLGSILVLRPNPDERPEGDSDSRWAKFGISLASLVFYIALLEALGYLLTTGLMLLVQLRLVENRSWRSSILIAALASVISLVVFKVLLKVSLPLGLIPLPPGW